MRAVRRKLPKPDGALQEKLFRWIDASEVARDHHANLEGVALLYAELCRRGLFSYRWFLQRLMARGETGSRDGVSGFHYLSCWVYHVVTDGCLRISAGRQVAPFDGIGGSSASLCFVCHGASDNTVRSRGD